MARINEFQITTIPLPRVRPSLSPCFLRRTQLFIVVETRASETLLIIVSTLRSSKTVIKTTAKVRRRRAYYFPAGESRNNRVASVSLFLTIFTGSRRLSFLVSVENK